MAEKLEACAETEDAGPECKGRLCTFTKGVVLLDDFLHRGVALQDMDFYHYAKFIVRTPIPHREDVLALHAKVGQFFVFEPHYCMSARFVQTLHSRRKAVRFLGPNCQRSNVNEGEENAQYKAFLFSTVRCTGCGECANPLLFRSALAMKANRRFGFAPAWKARRAEIEVLADRAQAKKREARRVEVLQDTTAFRAYREQVRKPPDGQPADGATEHFQSPDGKPADGVTEHFLKHVELRKFMHLHTANYKACCGLYEYHVPHANSERIVALISEYAELGVPWHREQLHLAEFVALRTREILFNSDLSVDAKNMAAQKAARHRGLVTEAEAEDPEPRVEQWRGDGEDVEGNIPDEDHVEMDGEESGHERNGEACKQVLQSKLLDILTRKAEIAQASASGHTRDMYKDMKKVHNIFAEHLESLHTSTSTTEVARSSLSSRSADELSSAMDHQAEAADEIRNKENISVDNCSDQQDKAVSGDAQAQTHRRDVCGRVFLAPKVTPELCAQGPIATAKFLCEAASLNEDQLMPAALIAKAMDKAWRDFQERHAEGATEHVPLIPLG